MQELVLILSGIAGAVTAGAIHKFPRPRMHIPTLGASPILQGQLDSLEVERQILTKTISRLYQSDVGLDKARHEKLLLRYQHQLGIVHAKIEKLESSKNHPDIGPLGDGLVTLMDQKLSRLDQRMYELSSKIAIANSEKPIEAAQVQPEPKKVSKPAAPKTVRPEPAVVQTSPQPRQETVRPEPIEITTLTPLSQTPRFPEIKPPETIKKPQEIPKVAPMQSVASTGQVQTTPEPAKTQTVSMPEPRLPDDDEDNADLDQIKGDIKRVLDKLAEAEVD